MQKNMQFILKARAGYAEVFREAFKLMDAGFAENPAEDCSEVIVFNVTCSPDKVGILEKMVPLEAFANIGFAGPPAI